jgi:hypothetical protein
MKSPEDSLTRIGDASVVNPGAGLRIESPFAFWNGEAFEMVCKDLTGRDLVIITRVTTMRKIRVTWLSHLPESKQGP